MAARRSGGRRRATPGRRRGESWWSRAANPSTAIGTVVSAVAAVIMLGPMVKSDPDPVNAVQFSSVQVSPPISLQDYQVRKQSRPQGFARGALRLHQSEATETEWVEPPIVEPEVVETTTEVTTDPVAPVEPALPSSDPFEPSTTATTTSGMESAGGRTGDVVPHPVVSSSGEDGQRVGPSSSAAVDDTFSATTFIGTPYEPIDEEAAYAFADASNAFCDASEELCPVDETGQPAPPEAAKPLIAIHCVDVRGERVEPEVAAARVSEVLDDSRRNELAQPLGVVVQADLELSGLRDTDALVSWSFWSDSGAQLYGEWLNSNSAYRLRPASDRDTASLDMWIPLPGAPGSYFVNAVLTVGGTTLASGRTESFG